jgi:hypothetical protein
MLAHDWKVKSAQYAPDSRMFALSQKIVQLVEEMYKVGAASVIPWMNPETRLKEKKKEARFLLLKRVQRKKAAIEGMFLLISNGLSVGVRVCRPTSDVKDEFVRFSIYPRDGSHCSSGLSTIRAHIPLARNEVLEVYIWVEHRGSEVGR